ncbi:MAG: hypothetical protein LBB08_02750 [Rickettsiales bacterium]|jgi:hypothetical protein|nr:hypothetical protein [Rickettsiales bacterium]
MNDILPSAAASFNNAALALPQFLRSAVLMLPVGWCAYALSDCINAAFFPVKKTREFNLAFWVELIMLGVLIPGQNWAAIRDGSSVLPFIAACCVFLLCMDATARLRAINPKMPKWWQNIEPKARKWIKLGLLAIGMGAAAASAPREWESILLMIGAVLFGVSAGFFGRKSKPAGGFTTLIMGAIGVAIAMQPEYFRFGQLGRLTIAHIGALALSALICAMTLAFGAVKPSGFMTPGHYRHAKWFMRLCGLLCLLLFAITESVPVLLVFFMTGLIASLLAVRHAARGTRTRELAGNLWALELMTFGVVTEALAISVIGLMVWRNNSMKNFWKTLLAVLK